MGKEKKLNTKTGYRGKTLVVDKIEDKLTNKVHAIRKNLAVREMVCELRGIQREEVDAILDKYEIKFLDFLDDGVFSPSFGISYPEKREIIDLDDKE